MGIPSARLRLMRRLYRGLYALYSPSSPRKDKDLFLDLNPQPKPDRRSSAFRKSSSSS